MRPVQPTVEYFSALRVDVAAGRVYWVVPPKAHPRLVGKEAGGPRTQKHSGKTYWVVKLGGIAFKRSQIVFLFKTGTWPADQVDHRNGDSLDDRGENLRAATHQQNAWNHKRRAKAAPLPMGVRQLPGGKFQARIACNKTSRSLGAFDTPAQAHAAYLNHRKALFGEFA